MYARRIARRAEFVRFVRVRPNLWINPNAVTHIKRKGKRTGDDNVFIYLSSGDMVIVEQVLYPEEFEWIVEQLEEF